MTAILDVPRGKDCNAVVRCWLFRPLSEAPLCGEADVHFFQKCLVYIFVLR